MKKFIIVFLFLMSMNASLGATRHVIQQNPYINNPYYRHQNYYQTEVLPRDLSALERYSMNKIYPRENVIQRLERLENLAFGSTQNGDIRTRYSNVETAILSRPQNNVKRNALGNIVSYFTGQPTGITPAIQTYDTFNYPAYNSFTSNTFGNQHFNQYSNGIFGHGYSMLNNGLGNGSSVRILP